VNKALRLWQLAILLALFTLWQMLAQPDLLPPFVWENPNRAAFFFGEPVKIFKAIWVWFSEGTIYQHLWVTLEETVLAFVIGSVLGLAVGLWLGLSPPASALMDPYITAMNAMPRVVLAPSITGKHPDHRVSAELVTDACFLSGLAKIEPELPHFRPFKLLHSLTYREDPIKPTFVVDISAEFERKLLAIRAYASQFDGVTQAGEAFPNGEPLYDIVRHQAAHYGSLIRVQYGEPFYTAETMRVDDLMALNVSTF